MTTTATITGPRSVDIATRRNRHRCESPTALLAHARAHDELAWAEIVRRYGSLVEATARRSGLSGSDVHEVTQVTWLRLVESIDKIRDPNRLPGWLATTARRESIRLALGAKRSVPTDLGSDEHGQAIAEPKADARLRRIESDDVVERSLSRLREPYQTVLRLLMREDRLTYAEVAELMSIPLGSVGPLKLRALKHLREGPIAWSA